MADGRVIIEFKSSGGSSGSGGEGGNKTAINPKTGEQKNQNDVLDTVRNVRSVMRTFKVRQIANLLIDELNYEINRYFELTDNVQGQRDMQIARTNINRIMNVASATISGALVGGPVGAGISFVLSTGKIGLDIYQGYQDQDLKIRQMDEQLEYTRLRAGYSLISGDKGENR